MTNFFDLNQGAIAVWTGGLGWFGGIAGGALGLVWYCWRNKQPYWRWLDLAALVVPLAHALGRIWDGLSQEIYGSPTTLAWGVLITRVGQRVAPYTDLTAYPLLTTRFHPVWAYEALGCVAIWLVLLHLWRRYRTQLQQGDLSLCYLALYGIVRGLLEPLRVNVSLLDLPFATINPSFLAAAAVGLGAIIGLIGRYRTRQSNIILQ